MLEMEAAAKWAAGDAALVPRLSSSMQWSPCVPTNPPALPDLLGDNATLPNTWLLSLGQRQPPDPVPPEVSALPGGIDQHTELGADIQPAASDGHSGSSCLRAIEGSYRLHNRKLKTKRTSDFWPGKFTAGYSTLNMGIASVNLSIQYCQALIQQHSKSFHWQGFRTRGEVQVLRSEIM